MGKDQELLEAARNGNVPVVEKILSQRAKRSGPLASLRRGPGANVQDSSGYSALHHAALNGHKEVVQLLLAHEASTNIVDQKGSSPLHLAAWTGDVDIVRLLLRHGPSVPNVNLTTKDNETALHCAAQYGHTAAVALLLESGCDPSIRSAREESALDLAAQYGRLETVELLVRTHPELMQPYSARGGARGKQFPHTPLHLASRNGHKAVVCVLLGAGMEVNARTAAGTALHEAAMCGKLEVARALLQGGVDLAARDAKRNTVMDLLGQFPPHVTHDIVALIRKHRNGGGSGVSESESCGDSVGGGGGGGGGSERSGEGRDGPLPPIPVPTADPALGSPYENVRVAPRCRGGGSGGGGGGGGGSLGGGDSVSPGTSPTHWEFYHHHMHHLHHGQRDDSCRGSGVSVTSSEGGGGGMFSRPCGPCDGGAPEDADRMSVSSTASSTSRERLGSNSAGGRPEPSQSIYMPMAPSHHHHPHARSPGSASKVSPTPPKKPPRRNLSVSPTHLQPNAGLMSMSCDGGGPGAPGGSAGAYEFLYLARSGIRSHGDLDLELVEAGGGGGAGGTNTGTGTGRSRDANALRRGRSTDQYVDMRGRVGTLAALEQGEAFQAFLNQRREELEAQAASTGIVPTSAAPYENLAIRTTNPRRKLRRHGTDRCYEHHEPVYRTELVPAAELLPPPLSLPAPAHAAAASSPSAASDDNGATFVSSAYITLKSSQESLLEEPHARARLKKMQEYKRRSRDMETETEEELLLALPSLDAASSGSLSSSVSLSDKSVSTDNNVEEYFGDAPFAGLFKGSTSQSAELGVRSSPAERPRTLRRLKNVYDGPVAPPLDHHRLPTSNSGGGGGGGGGGDKGGGSLSILSPFDEQEEWNKISEIMASFGTGLVRESVFVSELEKEFQNRLGLTHSESGAGSPMATSSLGHWLASLGLLEYESVFRAHGYDDLDFINGVLEEGDLRDMGVSSEKDRACILEAARSLPLTVREATAAAEAVEAAQAQAQAQAQALAAAAAAEGATNGEGDGEGGGEGGGDDDGGGGECVSAGVVEEGAAVDAWLRALRLDCYCDTFRKHLYTDMARVRRIWEVELTAVLEIGRVGHRRRILSSVGSAGGAPPLSYHHHHHHHRGSGPDLDDLTHDLNQLKNNIQLLKEEIREKLPAPPPVSSLPGGPGTTGTLRHSHKKSRPAPPPPTAAPATATTDSQQQPQQPTNGELEIRGPSELLEGVPATLTTRWRHPPHALVTGCVNYVASYLGSTVVKELRGTESTKKSIQKLKKVPRDATSAAPGTATPDIVLAISYRGVKFLNTLTQELVCEHEIRNIHCACQDADDLTHFAYITKDHASRSHYCHVFCVQTMDQATEIILTLGQAFEVAYQLALRDQFSSSGGGGRGRNGNGHARSQSAAAPAPGLSATAAPSPGGGGGGAGGLSLAAAAGHARSHSVNEIKLNGLSARETRGGGGTGVAAAAGGPTASPAKASPGANGAAAAPLVLKEEL